ncbi:LPXTG cell wall anchor domain-containing protein [Acrocarpospora phusangensis]|nr:LPXTG cell wall anchor domain-containing protein [Acrocarpospora phusangensis]
MLPFTGSDERTLAMAISGGVVVILAGGMLVLASSRRNDI